MFADYGSLDYKQHLNVRKNTYEVISNDMNAFMDKATLSGFINRVFEEYSPEAEASISHAIERKKESLQKQLKGIKDCEMKSQVIEKLLTGYREELLHKVKSYPKEVTLKFRINNRNFEMVMIDPCPEEKYYDRPGQYFKAVIEEYAEKTLYERESIFFKSSMTAIQSSIESGNLLQIRLRNGKSYEVKPYAIMADSNSLYHYLVGMSVLINGDEEEKITSFRISQISEVKQRPKSYKSGRITKQQKDLIEKKIQMDGVQFLLSSHEEIVVKLSERGKKMYKSQLHLRPQHIGGTKDDEIKGIYRFLCTQTQAEYYFFKFGAEAEIIAPEELRDRFIKKYENALGTYQKGYTLN